MLNMNINKLLVAPERLSVENIERGAVVGSPVSSKSGNTGKCRARKVSG